MDLILSVIPTEDGGMTYEVEREDAQRDLLLVHPDDGTPVYFTARDLAAGTRRAGIVREMAAIFALVRWVHSDADYPTSGLEFG